MPWNIWSPAHERYLLYICGRNFTKVSWKGYRGPLNGKVEWTIGESHRFGLVPGTLKPSGRCSPGYLGLEFMLLLCSGVPRQAHL